MGDRTLDQLLAELQALQTKVAGPINDRKLKSWTTGSIEARQYALEKRGAILDQISLLHKQDLGQLAVLRSRIQNTLQKVDRLPDDVLLHLFSLAVNDGTCAPEILASVCHRWMAVIYGDTGARLWSTIDLDIDSLDIVADLAERVGRYIGRSRSRHLTLILRDTDVETDEAASALLQAVTRPGFPRVRKLVVEGFDPFASWFPLKDPCPSLYHVSLKDVPIPDSEHPDGSPVFASPCPALRRFDLLPSSPLASQQIQDILHNVSKIASITHLDIKASDQTNGIYTCLSDFRQLEYLRWRSFPPEDGLAAAEAQAVPLSGSLSLPNLKTLVIASNVVRALSELEAPLVQVIHFGDIFVGADYWGLHSPVRFFALRKLTFVYPLWNSSYDMDALFDHPNLEQATWVLYPPDLVTMLRTLSLRLSQQPPQSSLSSLKWLNLVCVAPFEDGFHPADEGCDIELVFQLKSLFIYREALLPTNQPHFKVCLNHELANSCTTIAALVANHPDIIAGDVAWEPPDVGEVFDDGL